MGCSPCCRSSLQLSLSTLSPSCLHFNHFSTCLKTRFCISGTLAPHTATANADRHLHPPRRGSSSRAGSPPGGPAPCPSGFASASRQQPRTPSPPDGAAVPPFRFPFLFLFPAADPPPHSLTAPGGGGAARWGSAPSAPHPLRSHWAAASHWRFPALSPHAQPGRRLGKGGGWRGCALRPACCFGVSLCPFGSAAGRGCPYRHKTSSRGKPPSAASRPAVGRVRMAGGMGRPVSSRRASSGAGGLGGAGGVPR